MGGIGSTRWLWHTPATTVEECRILDVKRMVEEGVISAEQHRFGVWVWKDAQTGEITSRIGYTIKTGETAGYLKLRYTMTRTKEDLEYSILLQTIRPHFGGLRWYYTCPLRVNGKSCMRRVCKLYLPPGGRYYGCRYCYQLTYRSCQESDYRVRQLRMDPDALMAALQADDNRNFLIALKAYYW